MMNKLIIPAIFMIVSVIAKAEGPKPGFRDLLWASKPTSDMILVLPDYKGGYTMYERPTDVMFIGTVKLKSIHYAYYKETLYAVTIEAEEGTFNDLLTISTSIWGSYSERPNQFMNKYIWRSIDKAYGKTIAVIEENPLSEETSISILSISLMDRIDVDKQKANANAAKDM